MTITKLTLQKKMSYGEVLLIYWDLNRKDCTGCAWDHPSQRRHECLMDNSNNHIYWKTL